LRSRSNPAVNEHAISVHGYLNTDQCVRLLPNSGGGDRFGDGIGEPVGMPW
jgi:hypothetical protein